MINIKLFHNKSDRRNMYKKLEPVNPTVDEDQTPPEFIECEVIEHSSLENPRIVLSTRTNVLQANYLYIQNFGRYYYIDNHTLEEGKIVIDCTVDVLMSFAPEIAEEEIIIDRTSKTDLNNFYLEDDEIKEYSYPFTEIHKLKCISNNGFEQDNNYYVLALSGAVSTAEQEEGE